MTDNNALPKLSKPKPFDPSIHDRTAFSCGVDQVDNYLKLSAKKGTKADVVRVFVTVDPDDKIIGFYGINMHSIVVNDMPNSYKKKAGRHGKLPAAFIAMMGVDSKYQGKKVGDALLSNAVRRIAGISEQIGTTVIVLDILDDGNEINVDRRKKKYVAFGFIPLPDQPLRMFLPIQTARELSSSKGRKPGGRKLRSPGDLLNTLAPSTHSNNGSTTKDRSRPHFPALIAKQFRCAIRALVRQACCSPHKTHHVRDRSSARYARCREGQGVFRPFPQGRPCILRRSR